LENGNQRRDLTHVSDVVRAIELAIGFQGSECEAFNIDNGENHSVMDMIAHASAKEGKTPTITPAPPSRHPSKSSRPRKSQNPLGFTPLHPFTRE